MRGRKYRDVDCANKRRDDDDDGSYGGETEMAKGVGVRSFAMRTVSRKRGVPREAPRGERERWKLYRIGMGLVVMSYYVAPQSARCEQDPGRDAFRLMTQTRRTGSTWSAKLPTPIAQR